MTAYRIDKFGRTHSSNSTIDACKAIELLISDSRFATAVKIANDTLDCAWVIAGGYLRDIINDKPIKDLDIFVEKPFGTLRGRQGYETTDNSVIATEYITKYDVNVNYVLVPALHGLLDKFPIDISKIAFTSHGHFVVLPEFLSDVNNKTLTVHSNCKPEYLARIQKKYPDFRVSSPTAGFTFDFFNF